MHRLWLLLALAVRCAAQIPQCEIVSDNLYTPSSALFGTVNTAGTTVTYVSGDPFLSGNTPYKKLVAGQSVNIAGTGYTIATVTANLLTLTTSAGTQTGVQYIYQVPIPAGSSITLTQVVTPGYRVLTFVPPSPNIGGCINPGTYSALYSVITPQNGRTQYTKSWVLPQAPGIFSIGCYPGVPTGIEQPCISSDIWTVVYPGSNIWPTVGNKTWNQL